MKPDITFFGEALPSRFAKLHKMDLKGCDLLIVMGTSLQVAAAAALERINMWLCSGGASEWVGGIGALDNTSRAYKPGGC